MPNMHLKWVVFWRDFLDPVIPEKRDFLHDVFAHARYLREEEKGEEAGDAAESAEGYAELRHPADSEAMEVPGCLVLGPERRFVGLVV